MQLLKITSIPLKYNIETENASLKIQRLSQEQISQHSELANLSVSSEGIKIRMDSSAMRSSMGFKTVAQVAEEAPAKTQQTANSVTSAYVNMGNRMAQKGMTVAQYINQNMLSNTTIETAISQIPSVRIDTSWEPAKSEVNFEPAKTQFDWQSAQKKMEFVPSKLSLEIEQYANVDIEYIGGFSYVPPSSNPDYEEKSE